VLRNIRKHELFLTQLSDLKIWLKICDNFDHKNHSLFITALKTQHTHEPTYICDLRIQKKLFGDKIISLFIYD
jgi:hypothetical protein